MYPLAGNRDVPGFDTPTDHGFDADHVGGDVWVTDAAFAVMDHEDWSGLLLTYGGIDKAGHMWGGLNDVPPYPGTALAETHLAHLAKVADEQVGRVIAKLRADGELDDTLVVLTTDHAQNTAVHYHGQPGPGRGNYNWYYGADADETYLQPQPLIAGYVAATGGNVRAGMHDSALRSWLTDQSRPAKRQAASALAQLPDVRATYYRVGDHYRLHWEAPRSDFGRREWRWHRAHAQEIVDTAAADYGPDVIGLLANDTSYGVEGDHGGAQESVQRIPVAFYGAGVEAGRRPGTPIRSVDIMPTVLRAMGIEQTTPTDGRAYRLP
jgi:arylsulfatase A-like enzyme